MDYDIKSLLEMREFIFRLLADWRFHCINQKIEIAPNELCNIFEIDVPDNVEFMRAKNYDLGIGVEYRCYDGAQIRINIWKLP